MKRLRAGQDLTHQCAVRQRCGNIRGKGPATLTTINIENSDDAFDHRQQKEPPRMTAPARWGSSAQRVLPTSPLMITLNIGGINMFTPALGRYIKGVEYA